MNTHKIIQGDCIAGMRTLPDGCIQTCITSPPYFALRDYSGGEEEIGQEDTVEGYVQKMVEVFREVRRILRPDGTVWLNLGCSGRSTKRFCSTKPQRSKRIKGQRPYRYSVESCVCSTSRRMVFASRHYMEQTESYARICYRSLHQIS